MMDRRLDNVFSLFIFFCFATGATRMCCKTQTYGSIQSSLHPRVRRNAFPSLRVLRRAGMWSRRLADGCTTRERGESGQRKPEAFYTHTYTWTIDKHAVVWAIRPFVVLSLISTLSFLWEKEKEKKNEFVLLSSMKRSSCLSTLVRKIVMSHNELLRFPSLTKINKTQGRKTHESLNRGDSKKKE